MLSLTLLLYMFILSLTLLLYMFILSLTLLLYMLSLTLLLYMFILSLTLLLYMLSLTLLLYMLSFILCGSEYVHVFNCLFISVLFKILHVSSERVWDPSPYDCTCHKQRHGFSHHISWSFCVQWLDVRADCSFG